MRIYIKEAVGDEQTYFYDGPAYYFGTDIGVFRIKTVAKSLGDAIKNIRFQIAKKANQDVRSIRIDSKNIQVIGRKSPEKTSNSQDNTKCKSCGNKLNFDGTCNNCDTKQLSIFEDVEIHDTLNPKIWTEDEELIPEIKNKILELVEEFETQLAENDIDILIDDILIIGSNANYNYTSESDLDVHIIADESKDCDQKHLPLIYDIFRKNFNSKYDITFNGVNVELYVEDKNELHHTSAGEYSLNKGWISKPAIVDIPEIDQKELDKRIDDLQIKIENLLNSNSSDDIDLFLEDLYDQRKAGIKENGEFDLNNLAFKEMRRLGYLDDLREHKDKLISDELSLE